jgi:hypothetical protein
MSSTLYQTHPVLGLESLDETQKLEATIKNGEPLAMLSDFNRKDSFIEYITGAILHVMFNQYKEDLTSARQKYSYNSFSELVQNHEEFSHRSQQHWYGLKDYYALVTKQGLSPKEISDNKVRYTKVLALKGQEFDSKEEFLENLKKPVKKEAELYESATSGLPLNPQAPPAIQSSTSLTGDNDGYIYPADEENLKTRDNNVAVLPPEWENIPKDVVDVRTFKTVMNKEDYDIFLTNLTTLMEDLSSKFPKEFIRYENGDNSTLRNKTLCFALTFLLENFQLASKQYKQFNQFRD